MQAGIESCEASRIVVNCGRRAGKTHMSARKACKAAAKGRKVLYTAPVADQTDSFWDLCTEWLADAIAAGIVHKNVTKRILTFPGGGRIVARTAYKPDHMRGTYADLLIFDEFAYQNPDVWEKVGMPMLLDNGGDAIFPSTPNGRNHFYHMYLRDAGEVRDSRWRSFSFPSTANPHLSKKALDELTEDMTEEDYKQEILAEFVEGEGQVFKLVYDDFLPAKSFEAIWKEHKKHRIVAGLDWGRIKDATVLSVGCAYCNIELMLERFKEVDYPTQRNRIKGTYDKFLDEGFEIEILAESNSMGLPNIEQLREDGVPIQEFATSHKSKPQIVQALKLAFEKRSWRWIENLLALRELEAYEAKVTPLGYLKYSAPAGLHDDTVMARMIMHWQALTGKFTLA